MATRRLTASELGIEAVDLTATDNNRSGVLDVRQAFSWTAIVDITETGSPSEGAADLIVEIVTSDGATINLSHTIASGIDLQTSGERATVVWGHGVSAAAIGSGTTPTISTTPNIVSNVDFIRLNLKASTAHDGDTCTGSVTLLIEEV